MGRGGTVEHTLVIIKPDAVSQHIVGEVLQRLEKAGLAIIAMKMVTLTKKEAEVFYAVHRRKSFFASLTDFMSSGPIVALVVGGENAIAHVRELMGATDPAQATRGTIRRDFATSIERNVIHGSDSQESAAVEIPYFFSGLDILSPSHSEHFP